MRVLCIKILCFTLLSNALYSMENSFFYKINHDKPLLLFHTGSKKYITKLQKKGVSDQTQFYFFACFGQGLMSKKKHQKIWHLSNTKVYAISRPFDPATLLNSRLGSDEGAETLKKTVEHIMILLYTINTSQKKLEKEGFVTISHHPWNVKQHALMWSLFNRGCYIQPDVQISQSHWTF